MWVALVGSDILAVGTLDARRNNPLAILRPCCEQLTLTADACFLLAATLCILVLCLLSPSPDLLCKLCCVRSAISCTALFPCEDQLSYLFIVQCMYERSG